MEKIVIMGATSGIGLRVAVKLALKGCKVGVAGRKADVLYGLKQRFPDLIETEVIDITDADAPSRLGSLIGKLGGMDTYLHVSGIGYENQNLDPANDLRVVETNVAGFVRMVDAAFNYFRENNIKGNIAAITSVAGSRGIGPMAAYCSSKKFQQTYLESLEQLSNNLGLNIRFNDIRPGWIRTPLLEADRKYLMLMNLDYAVPRIVRSIGRNRSRISYIDFRWRVASLLMRVVPRFIWSHLDIPVHTR